MNLTFPTHLLFPAYPTRPTEEQEEATLAFLAALRTFYEHFLNQNTSTRRYFDAASFYFGDTNSESAVRSEASAVTHEAIAAVIENINQRTKTEYVWDAVKNCWVRRQVPV